MPNYLKKVAALNISDEAYAFFSAIGPKRFKTLKELGILHDEIWEKLSKWVASAPRDVKKFIVEHCAEPDCTEDEAVHAFYSLYVTEVEGLILVSADYFEKSTVIVKKIFKIMKNFNTATPEFPETIEDMVDGCLNEAIEFAGYAGMFD